MNFVIIDNLLQIVLLMTCAVLAAFFGLRYRARQLLILSLSYACFATGTVYYVLHVAICGTAPQIFYVSEISWIAAYIFILSIQILRSEGIRLSFSIVAAAPALVYSCGAMYYQIMLYMTLLFVAAAGAIMYISIWRLYNNVKGQALDICSICCLMLQLTLYLSSFLMRDFLHFNLYFALDIALSLSFAALLPISLREVRRK